MGLQLTLGVSSDVNLWEIFASWTAASIWKILDGHEARNSDTEGLPG